MRKTTLVAVITSSSMLLGAVAAQAEPWIGGGADSDGDGRLSHAEWSQIAPTLSASFSALDANDDGQLTREEFTGWHDSLKARMGTDNQATAAPDEDSVTGSNVAVGAARSNVDKKSTNPTYHPNAAGTVGDDPAKPTSTSAPPDAKDKANDKHSGSTDQWMVGGADLDGNGFLSPAELTKVSPTLSESFRAMDVDSDQQVSHGEFRSWHESLKARMGAE